MEEIKKVFLKSFLKPKGRDSFCRRLKGKAASILDVGCGNGSPQIVKALAPDCFYTGVDVADYNNTSSSLACADRYVLLEPECFADGIAGLEGEFDAAISRHNLEHCNHPEKTLSAICGKLRKGGMLYLAFPSEASVGFPHREGTLNFYDDPTHVYLPRFDDIIQRLRSEGMEIRFAKKSYRPLLFCIAGGGN